jgi:hypothetical protein
MRPRLSKAQRDAIAAHNKANPDKAPIPARYAADRVEHVLNPILLAADVEQLEIPPEHIVAKARSDRERFQQPTPGASKMSEGRMQAQVIRGGRGGRSGGRGGGGAPTPMEDTFRALVKSVLDGGVIDHVKSAVREAIAEELPGVLRNMAAAAEQVEKAETPVRTVAAIASIAAHHYITILIYHLITFVYVITNIIFQLRTGVAQHYFTSCLCPNLSPYHLSPISCFFTYCRRARCSRGWQPRRQPRRRRTSSIRMMRAKARARTTARTRQRSRRRTQKRRMRYDDVPSQKSDYTLQCISNADSWY